MRTDSHDLHLQLGTHAHFTPHVDILMGYLLVGICVIVPRSVSSICM